MIRKTMYRMLLICALAVTPVMGVTAADEMFAEPGTELTEMVAGGLEDISNEQNTDTMDTEKETVNFMEAVEPQTDNSEANEEKETSEKPSEKESETTTEATTEATGTPWFHLSLKDIFFQILGGILLICVPGCYIYWKAKKN